MTLVWMFPILSLISSSFSNFSRTVPCALIITGTTLIFRFRNFCRSLIKYTYLVFHYFSFFVFLFFCLFFFHINSLICFRGQIWRFLLFLLVFTTIISAFPTSVKWSVRNSKPQRNVVSFFKTYYKRLCIALSPIIKMLPLTNFPMDRLPRPVLFILLLFLSQLATFYVLTYLLYSRTVCICCFCVLSIFFTFVKLVIKSLFWLSIKRDSFFFLRFALCNSIHVDFSGLTLEVSI